MPFLFHTFPFPSSKCVIDMNRTFNHDFLDVITLFSDKIEVHPWRIKCILLPLIIILGRSWCRWLRWRINFTTSIHFSFFHRFPCSHSVFQAVFGLLWQAYCTSFAIPWLVLKGWSLHWSSSSWAIHSAYFQLHLGTISWSLHFRGLFFWTDFGCRSRASRISLQR